MNYSVNQQERKLKESVYIALFFTSTMWMSKLIEVGFDTRLYKLGIYPRAIDGLKGILFSPFIHNDWLHLLSNSSAFIILVTMLFYFYRTVAFQVLVFMTLLTGFSVWLFANSSYHIGASGVIYSLMTFALFSGLFKKNRQSIVLSLIILTIFSGMFTGISPVAVEDHVSWESHLSGAVVGLVSAFLFKNSVQVGEQQITPDWAAENEELDYMFPRDVFEKTKVERYLERKREEEALDNVYTMTYVDSFQSFDLS